MSGRREKWPELACIWEHKLNSALHFWAFWDPEGLWPLSLVTFFSLHRVSISIVKMLQKNLNRKIYLIKLGSSAWTSSKTIRIHFHQLRRSLSPFLVSTCCFLLGPIAWEWFFVTVSNCLGGIVGSAVFSGSCFFGFWIPLEPWDEMGGSAVSSSLLVWWFGHWEGMSKVQTRKWS